VTLAGEPNGHAVTSPTAARLLWRALARRCPVCGRGRMFDGWFSLRARCDDCGFWYERDEEEDYWLAGDLIFRPLGVSDCAARAERDDVP
jgi:uncharacterized protein (DUF983 family)